LVTAVHGGRTNRTEITMTTSYLPPNRHPHVDHDASTFHRPQMTFVPQVGPQPVPAESPSTWTAGWLVSGLAAVLSVAALGVVGGYALDAFVGSEPTPESTSVSTPAIATEGGVVATPTPVLPAPAIAVSPGLPGSAPTVGAPRIIVIPGPTAAPAAEDPVVTPPEPVVDPPKPMTPPKPPLGIGTCDLTACDSTPTPPPLGIGTCDLVACPPSASRP
jgi:hypothetical protein